VFPAVVFPQTLNRLVFDGKALRGFAVETEGSSYRFDAQVEVYARTLGMALAQTAPRPLRMRV
jgi:hypothetical protein